MKTETEDTKKEAILELLKSGEKSTTNISREICYDFYKTMNLLKILESENKIKKIEVAKYIFWSLKK